MKYFILIAIAVSIIACTPKKPERPEPIGPIVIDKNTGNTLRTGWYRIVDSSAFKRQIDPDTTWYYIDPSPILTARNVKSIDIVEGEYGMLQMEIAFNRNAVAIWEDATRKLADNHKQIAFIVNDKLLYAPLVVAAIPDGVGVMSLPDATRERLETIIQEIEKEMPK